MTWYMIWYDMIYDMVWYDILYDIICYGMVCYDLIYDMIRFDIWYDTIYLLTAIELTPGGSSTVHNYNKTIHRITQRKEYTEQYKYINKNM